MQSVVENLFDNFQKFQQRTKKLWNDSKFFRIASLVTGSIAAGLAFRTMYIKLYRKTCGLPPGVMGFLPFIGNSMGIFDKNFLCKMCKLGPVVSILIGPYHTVLINEPHLAKKFYSDPRTAEQIQIGNRSIDDSFAVINGKEWSERRRIIYSNLMTTMKASYVETATKKFIKSKAFPIFDNDIKNNNATCLRKVFRPIGFNIVLQACLGKELTSLQDPLWEEFDKRSQKTAKDGQLQTIIGTIFGFEGKFSLKLQRLLTGDDFAGSLRKLTDIVEKFTKSEQNTVNVKKDAAGNVKLFNDYIQSYANNEDAKFTRRQLLSDMAIMFTAATDTTFSGLTGAMLLAAKYDDIQEELHKEIVTAFGNNVENIELQHQGIMKIPKLRAFVHEALRILPPLPFSGFREIKDKGLVIDATKFGGKAYNVPIGVYPLVNVAGIGNEPKYWVQNYDKEKHENMDMEKVHFEFWMDKDGHFSKKLNSTAFLIFHSGKRDCVGQALAIKELYIVLAMIFMKYRVKSIDGNTDVNIESVFNGLVNEPVVQQVRLEKR